MGRNRVKFWFIKNYMSPQMKRFVPHMAAQYGFEYEFVTYRWPSWLHRQVLPLLIQIDAEFQTILNKFLYSNLLYCSMWERYNRSPV